MTENNKAEVNKLLEMYQTYKSLLDVQSRLSSRLARSKLSGQVDSRLAESYELLSIKLQNLSDAMTFANPVIWIMYKYEAYKNEAQAIRTMHDLRVHCSKEGYICTKRFTYLNEQLVLREMASLNDSTVYPDDMTLDVLVQQESLLALTSDPTFMRQWTAYEYNQTNGKVAKWATFPVS